MSDTDTNMVPTEPSEPIRKWEERENGFGVEELGPGGTNDWEPEDGREGDTPPGKLPYISIGVARRLVGDAIPPRRNMRDAVSLEETLRDMIAKRAMVRIHLRNLQVRSAGLLARIHTMSSQSATTGLWARYMECISAQTKLLTHDSNLSNEIIATATALGKETGAIETPEEGLLRARPTAAEGGPKRLPKARRAGGVIDVNADDA